MDLVARMLLPVHFRFDRRVGGVLISLFSN